MRAPPPLSLKLIFPPHITTTRIIRSSRGPTLRRFRNPMADEAETPPIDAAKNKEEQQKPEPKKSEVPSPPEKPEPGDCCGSGCVRCVWDVYYDELEEYNKLYKCDSAS